MSLLNLTLLSMTREIILIENSRYRQIPKYVRNQFYAARDCCACSLHDLAESIVVLSVLEPECCSFDLPHTPLCTWQPSPVGAVPRIR